jgi:DNA-binding CsgD family transcriptional regulator
MSGHFTKPRRGPTSQNFPPVPPDAVPNVTLADTYVVLCDWHGHVVWKSGAGDRIAIGEEVWKYASNRSRDILKGAVASVVTLREKCMIEVESDRDDHFRFWMWPLSDPEIALCILALRIPSELALLTDREKACLGCLAQGKSTRVIAKELEIGLTTVHTHLRRSREKLGLASGEALIGFAARYFYCPSPSEVDGSASARKRSG